MKGNRAIYFISEVSHYAYRIAIEQAFEKI
jgi:hypothetical protein